MRVYHYPDAGEAEIHRDGQLPITLTNVRTRQELIGALWEKEFVLGRTSHWTNEGGRWRHGLDPAPGSDETAA